MVCVWRRRRTQLSHQGNYRGVIELRPRVPQKTEKLLLRPRLSHLSPPPLPVLHSTFFFFSLPPHTTTPSQVEALIRTSGNPPGKSPGGGGGVLPRERGKKQEVGDKKRIKKKKQGMRNRSDKCARCRRAGNLYSSSPPG